MHDQRKDAQCYVGTKPIDARKSMTTRSANEIFIGIVRVLVIGAGPVTTSFDAQYHGTGTH
jgi:hypothetical protein